MLQSLPVHKFNWLCGDAVSQWFRFHQSYGYVAYVLKDDGGIKAASWAKTKKQAITNRERSDNY